MPRTRRQRRGGVETSADDQEGGTDDSLVAQRLPVHLGLDQRLDDARSWVETAMVSTETGHDPVAAVVLAPGDRDDVELTLRDGSRQRRIRPSPLPVILG